MAHTEILLLKPIQGLGAEGDTVKVRAGFARNYLLPRLMALPVTLSNRKHVESLRARRAAREGQELEGARELSVRLKAVALTFAVKTGDGGKMFGSITNGDLHTKLEEQGFKLEKKRIHIPGGHVKVLGKHEATIKLHEEVSVEIAFEVVSENPIVEAPKTPEAAAGAGGDKKEHRPRKQYEQSDRKPSQDYGRKTAAEMLLDEIDREIGKPADKEANPEHKAKKKVKKGKSGGEKA